MASFRSGIKIISDVSVSQGLALLRRSISAEHLLGLVLNDKRSASTNRPVSPSIEEHMTDVVAAEKPWFAAFNDRQAKEAQEPRPKRKMPQPSVPDAPQTKNKFLVPYPGPQVPNRFLSYDYCKKDPPVPFKGPHPSLRDCHKNIKKPCFMDTYQPKVVETSETEVSRVACGGKLSKSSKFCEKKSSVKAFSVCPKPVKRRPIFKCPEAPKPLPLDKKLMIPKCEERKPPSFMVCPKPPARKLLPMCLVLSGKISKESEKKPKPPPTPRRCVCANDPEFDESYLPPPLYKMNPEIPFPVCPKKKMAAREPYNWPSTNKVCKGESKGSCAMMGCDDSKKMTKSATCKSIRGEPCVEAHACPYHPSRPPPPPPQTCGPVTRPAFPTGPYTSAPTSAAPSTTAAPKQLPSSTATPKKVKSLTTATSKKVSSSVPTARSHSASSSVPRTTSSSASLPKQSGSAATKSKAGSVSQPSKPSSKPSNAMALNQSTKLDCNKMAFNNKNDKSKSERECIKLRLPGCRVPTNTVCGIRKTKKKKCVKIPVPTRCFTDWYKAPSFPKITAPCPPSVHLPLLAECSIMLKTKHLQPKEPILAHKSPFVLPPPIVELFIDPSIGACCEASGTQPPPPIPCTPVLNKKPKSVPQTVPEKKEDTKGCECTFLNFFRSLLAYLKGTDECPKPPDQVKKAIVNIELPSAEEEVRNAKPKTASSAMDPSCRDRKPRGKDTRLKRKKTPDGMCLKFKLPGCKDRVREDCTIISPETCCKKRLAPRPSFSECVRDDFPDIPCTECRVSLKRSKSLTELKEKGLRLTPENLRVHLSKCSNPTSKGCETVLKKLDCFKLSHQCRMSPCSRMGVESPKSKKLPEKEAPKNPPRPTREYCGPRAEPKKCEKPPVSLKKDCKNLPPNPQSSKNLPCNPQDEKPANNPKCDQEKDICEEIPEPYRMPKEDCLTN